MRVLSSQLVRRNFAVYSMTKVGRPTKYRPEYAKQARKLCGLGATNQELADFFEVSIPTIWHWANEHREFFNAIKVSKTEADERVKRSLYHKAVGYSYEGEKIIQDKEGNVSRIPTREHVPPSDTAAIFWLKNRRPEEWRDKVEIQSNKAIEVVHRVIDERRDEPEQLEGGEVQVIEDRAVAAREADQQADEEQLEDRQAKTLPKSLPGK